MFGPDKRRVATSLDPAGKSARATGLTAVYDPVVLGGKALKAIDAYRLYPRQQTLIRDRIA
jgi:hypothetical protein